MIEHMFESDRRPDAPIEWDQTMDYHPGPYQPGWRHTWFRRHRTQPVRLGNAGMSQLPAP
jgi:hypothetical protein